MGKSISQILIEKLQVERYRQLQDRQIDKAKESKKLYMYQNITTRDVILPRPTHSGRTVVGGREKFVGGECYKQVSELMCLNEILAAEKEKPEVLLENTVVKVEESKGEVIVADKKEQILLTEIPEIYKEEGKVEYVMKSDNEQILQESDDKKEAKKKKLIKESGISGVKFFG